VPELGTPGSERGVLSNEHSYRDPVSSTTVLTITRLSDRSTGTAQGVQAMRQRVPTAAWLWNLLHDAAYARAPRGRKPLGKAGISPGTR